MKQKNSYKVTVGNVGTMEYTSKKLALECFETYANMSTQNITRAAGESVVLFENDEIIKEHIGALDQTDENMIGFN